MEEETYSLIFTSLKHPIRRRILRMLSDKPLAYSEILEALAMDSGHLSYHIMNLGELIARTSDGKYRLSSIGLAAAHLMEGVEEQTTPIIQPPKKQTTLKALTLLFVIILASALVPVSLLLYSYTTSEVSWERQHSVVIPANQTFSFNLTILYEKTDANFSYYDAYYKIWTPIGMTDFQTTYVAESYYHLPQPIEAASFWEEDHATFVLYLNGRGSIKYRIYDYHGTLVMDNSSSTDDPVASSLAVFIYTVKGSGTWRFEAEYLPMELGGPLQTNALLNAGIKRERHDKPYYYCGIAGLLIAAICPSLILVLRSPKK